MNFLTPYLFWIKIGAAAVLVAAIVWAVVAHDNHIAKANYTAGYNARVAEEMTSAAKAKAAADWLDKLGAQATANFHTQLNTDLPQIEGTTNATAERVKIVYRDHPVPAGACVRPAGVVRELEAARTAANSAAAAH